MPSSTTVFRPILLLALALALVAAPLSVAAADAPASTPVSPSPSPASPCTPETSSLAEATLDPSIPAATDDSLLPLAETASCTGDVLAPLAAEFTIEAGDLWFGPNEFTISSEGTTTITLEDVGYAVHNLTVDELGLLVVASPGHSGQVVVADPEPGVYQFYCSVSGHREAGMVGTLVVR